MSLPGMNKHLVGEMGGVWYTESEDKSWEYYGKIDYLCSVLSQMEGIKAKVIKCLHDIRPGESFPEDLVIGINKWCLPKDYNGHDTKITL